MPDSLVLTETGLFPVGDASTVMAEVPVPVPTLNGESIREQVAPGKGPLGEPV